MALLFIIIFLVVLCFAAVLLVGAPYLPSHGRQIEIALDELKLERGETIYELGAGDGKVMIYAAKRGYRSVGYELNPIIFCIAWLRTRRYKNSVRLYYKNFWDADLSHADGVFVFLLDKYMEKLDKKLSGELRPGVRLASYTFKIPRKTPVAAKSGVYVYEY